jgi:hypothetical protein
MLAMSMPELSLLFFMGVFVALVVYLAVSRAKRWERIARIPLEDLPSDEVRDDEHAARAAGVGAESNKSNRGGSNNVR